MTLPRDWPALAEDHATAVEEFLAEARRFGPDRWTAPIAPGKWSPAEVTAHLSETYGVLHANLAGGAGMRVVVPPLKRWIIRHVFLSRILDTGIFPTGARAPRETRPREVEPDAEAALAALAARTARFAAAAAERGAAGTVRLTHAYFGRLSLRQAMRLSTVHTRHHARQLAAANPAPPSHGGGRT